MEIVTIEEGPYKGWSSWNKTSVSHFSDLIGRPYFREGPDGQIECRAETGPPHGNILGQLHGGYLMAFIDQAMFIVAGYVGNNAVTLSCSTEFLGAGVVGKPIDASGEVLRETGRLIFVRGLVTQEGSPVCAFSGTLRKVTRRA